MQGWCSPPDIPSYCRWRRSSEREVQSDVAHREEPWSDDADLVAHILRGSTAHFDMLYEAYFSRVYRFALKRLRDPAEAEDVTQEVFFTVFNALPSFQGNSSLLVWIFGITRNTVNRRFRRARPTIESLDGDDAREIPTGEAPAEIGRASCRERVKTAGGSM